MNGNELSGQIAVIKRMTCEFGSKVLAAQNNGAIAVIIINTEGSPLITMSAGTDGGSVTIPSVMISYEDGIAFISALEGGETIVGELMEDPNVISNDGSLDNGIVAH
jgi:extracellular elastinolytic metalloproteinase